MGKPDKDFRCFHDLEVSNIAMPEGRHCADAGGGVQFSLYGKGWLGFGPYFDKCKIVTIWIMANTLSFFLKGRVNLLGTGGGSSMTAIRGYKPDTYEGKKKSTHRQRLRL